MLYGKYELNTTTRKKIERLATPTTSPNRQMFTDTTFKTLSLIIATYLVFFAYTLTGNRVLECIMTVLLMVNVAVLTNATNQADLKEVHFNPDIYDDAPMNDEDDDEDECDSECDCECETEPETEANAEADAEGEAAAETETAAAEPETAAAEPETAALTEEELAKLHLDLSVSNEPTPFSVRALVRAFDNKSPTNAADLSGGGLPPCSHSTDLSGATPAN